MTGQSLTLLIQLDAFVFYFRLPIKMILSLSTCPTKNCSAKASEFTAREVPCQVLHLIFINGLQVLLFYRKG